jgi:hypothetical protein
VSEAEFALPIIAAFIASPVAMRTLQPARDAMMSAMTAGLPARPMAAIDRRRYHRCMSFCAHFALTRVPPCIAMHATSACAARSRLWARTSLDAAHL